jgi:acetyl esterase/lipase
MRRGLVLLCAAVFWPISLGVLIVGVPLYALGTAAVFACNLVRASNYDAAATRRLAWLAAKEAWWLLGNARLLASVAWYYLRTAPTDNVWKDIDYRAAADASPLSPAASQRCKLDVYHHGVGAPLKPVVLFIYGGAWGSGDKWMYSRLAAQLRCECDAVVVVIGYATFPAATMVDMVRAVHDAVQWTSSYIGRYGGDAKRITGVGHSAGAHLLVTYALRWAMSRAEVALPPGLQDTAVDEALGCPSPVGLLASPLRKRDPSNAAKPGSPSSFDSPPYPTSPLSLSGMARSDDSGTAGPAACLLRGIVGFSGVYDLTSHLKFEEGRGVARVSTMAAATGGHWSAMSPTLLVDALSDAELAAVDRFLPRRVRIAHGDGDATVDITQSRELVRAARRSDAAGGRWRFEEMKGVGHVDVVFGPLTAPGHHTVRVVANALA